MGMTVGIFGPANARHVKKKQLIPPISQDFPTDPPPWISIFEMTEKRWLDVSRKNFYVILTENKCFFNCQSQTAKKNGNLFFLIMYFELHCILKSRQSGPLPAKPPKVAKKVCETWAKTNFSKVSMYRQTPFWTCTANMSGKHFGSKWCVRKEKTFAFSSKWRPVDIFKFCLSCNLSDISVFFVKRFGARRLVLSWRLLKMKKFRMLLVFSLENSFSTLSFHFLACILAFATRMNAWKSFAKHIGLNDERQRLESTDKLLHSLTK